MTAIELPKPVTSLALDAGWHRDPMGEHRLRYFDGAEWTDHVTHFGPWPCEGCDSVDTTND